MDVNRRQLLTGSTILVGASALATALPKTIKAQPGGPPSPYTLAERDRRWAALRVMMTEQGVDCLVVPNLSGDFTLHYAQYITNKSFSGHGIAILPAEGEAAAFGMSPGPGAWATPYGKRGEPLGPAVADLLNGMGHGNSTIGVVGTENNIFGLNEFTAPGLMLYSVWSEVQAGLPEATFKDVTSEFAKVNMVKGSEEIAAFEKAAQLGEEMHNMLLGFTRPGITDRQFRAQIEEFLIHNGATADVKALEIQPGPVQQGHVINTEYGIEAFGGYAQVTLCMSVGDPSPLSRELHQVAQECFAAGLEVIRPGITFREVFEPMEKVVSDAGYWHGFPVIHGMRPVVLAGPVGIGQPIGSYADPLGADIVLEPGMSISFEPGARMGRMAQVKVGASAFVTDDGVRLLNNVGRTMQVI